ncbi:hypothetical protein BJV78DRAFT_1123598 [Lactifluus subvellereus]|nr:hypothetical protein BJV78DRAFT_1123598 [Lactifluus subvellereus]
MKKQEPTRQVKALAQEEAFAPGFVKPLLGRSTSVGLPLKHPPRIPTSTAADLEALADDLEAHATTTSEPDALPRIYLRQSLRPRLLAILANTQDAASAWAAYRALLVLPRSPDKARPKVPLPHRHRLLRLLAAAPRPRPRGRYAQVLAVLRALQDAGGTIQRWEWNLLLDCAGKEGWRRPREEHFRAALALLAEMRALAADHTRRAPGGGGRKKTVGGTGGGAASGDVGGGRTGTTAKPDIFSYTTLLAHAVRTRAPAAVRHAAQLLARAGLAPGAYAHTALLCFFAQRGDLAGVRDTLFRMRRHEEGGAGLAQAAFNVVLWAFAYNGRLDVAQAMYRVVRARVLVVPLAERRRSEEVGEEEEGGEDVAVLESTLAEREMVVIAPGVVPDAATYHILIQAYAYHGDLRASVETLTDMLISTSTTSPAPLSRLRGNYQQKQKQGGSSPPVTATRSSSLTAFRAIFLGFARHGVLSPRASSSSSTAPSESLFGTTSRSRSGSEWTLATLEALFARFLELPRDTPLRETVLFWLVSAFARTSGHDAAVLRDVFERVEGRFGYGRSGRWSGRLARIREKVFSCLL